VTFDLPWAAMYELSEESWERLTPRERAAVEREYRELTNAADNEAFEERRQSGPR
jgi:hypothetical protein